VEWQVLQVHRQHVGIGTQPQINTRKKQWQYNARG